MDLCMKKERSHQCEVQKEVCGYVDGHNPNSLKTCEMLRKGYKYVKELGPKYSRVGAHNNRCSLKESFFFFFLKLCTTIGFHLHMSRDIKWEPTISRARNAHAWARNIHNRIARPPDTLISIVVG